MPTASQGGSSLSLKLKVNGKWLAGKELEEYIGKRDEKYWAMVKSELDGENHKRH